MSRVVGTKLVVKNFLNGCQRCASMPMACTCSLHQLCYIFSPSLSPAIAMQLSFELQLEALGFCKSHKPPEALVKILLDTAVNAFAKCSVSH